MLKRVGAAFLMPILLIVGMQIVVAVHDVLVEIMGGVGIDDVFGIGFLISVISILLFAGLCWALYLWVGAGGPGVFDDW